MRKFVERVEKIELKEMVRELRKMKNVKGPGGWLFTSLPSIKSTETVSEVSSSG